jgi:hypothetical protein
MAEGIVTIAPTTTPAFFSPAVQSVTRRNLQGLRGGGNDSDDRYKANYAGSYTASFQKGGPAVS